MTMSVGTKLGAYEILGPLGKGGMGEVYRARDSKLKRDVAIKVLPDAFCRMPTASARFQREAEMLATLNHSHIAAIHDLADFGESRFLVLELVEGETLADRIARGPIPLDEALPIAKQIAKRWKRRMRKESSIAISNRPISRSLPTATSRFSILAWRKCARPRAMSASRIRRP